MKNMKLETFHFLGKGKGKGEREDLNSDPTNIEMDIIM
jgi:hypothetical protein